MLKWSDHSVIVLCNKPGGVRAWCYAANLALTLAFTSREPNTGGQPRGPQRGGARFPNSCAARVGCSAC